MKTTTKWAVSGIAGALFGFVPYLLLQLTAMSVAGSAGVWLFYVQHQFETTYWTRDSDWSAEESAFAGSSHYDLPAFLRWFTANIGYHHIHHLSSRIPNYHLERCHQAHEMFRQVKPVTLFSSFKSFTFRLWDEQRKKLVGYRHLRNLRRGRRQMPH